jgi:hypothetical protein
MEAGEGGETSMSYSHSWGRGGSESKSIKVESRNDQVKLL